MSIENTLVQLQNFAAQFHLTEVTVFNDLHWIECTDVKWFCVFDNFVPKLGCSNVLFCIDFIFIVIYMEYYLGKWLHYYDNTYTRPNKSQRACLPAFISSSVS